MFHALTFSPFNTRSPAILFIPKNQQKTQVISYFTTDLFESPFYCLKLIYLVLAIRPICCRFQNIFPYVFFQGILLKMLVGRLIFVCGHHLIVVIARLGGLSEFLKSFDILFVKFYHNIYKEHLYFKKCYFWHIQLKNLSITSPYPSKFY